MRPGQDANLDDVGIHMYGSTDEGGSFYVKRILQISTLTPYSMRVTLTGGIGLAIRRRIMRMQNAWLGVNLRN